MSTFTLHQHYIWVQISGFSKCTCGWEFDGDDSIDRIRMHFLDVLLDEWYETRLGRWWLKQYAKAEGRICDPDAEGQYLRNTEDRLAYLEHFRATVMNDLWTKYLEN